MTGVPEIVDFMRRRRRSVAMLFFLAACASAFLPAYFALAHGMPWLQLSTMRYTCTQLGNSADCLRKFLTPGESAASYGLWAVWVLGPLVVAIGFLWLGRRSVRLSISDLLRTDRRPPVLFLRAFKDDQVPLRSGRQPLLLWLLGLGRIPTSLDQILLEEGTPHGPVVALGNPNDPLPPFGAARGYFTHVDWQGAVEKLAADASAIVICVDDSEGVWWEVDLVARRGYLGKTCFFLHPRYRAMDANREIVARLVERLGLGQHQSAQLQGASRPPAMLFFLAANNNLCVGRKLQFTRMASILGVRWFLRSKLSHQALPDAR